MKFPFLITTFLLLSLFAHATQYTSASSGNWSSSSSWSPSGVPGANDTVLINGGYTITVTADAACKKLTLNNVAGVLSASNTTLTINTGTTLTVDQNVNQNVTVANLVTGACQININGTLTVGGDLTQNHTLALLGNSNNILIGNATNSGVFNLNGNLVMQNGFISALGNANKITLANGTFDINGNINFSAGAINLLSTNEINANDNGSYDGKTKNIYFAGSFSGTDKGTLTNTDSNGNSNYSFTYDGTTTQYLTTQNIYYKNLKIGNSNTEVELINNPANANLAGTLTILSGGVLNTKSYNLDAINSYASQIIINSGGTLKVENAAGVPAQKVSGSYVCVPNSTGTIEYFTNSALTVFDEDFDYTQVTLTGTGNKTYSTNGSRQIDNSFIKVHSITLVKGTFTIPTSKKLQLSASGTKTVSLRSGTLLAIQGDFTALDSYFDINYTSTVWYQQNGDQTVYSFISAPAVIEPYGILKLARESGTGSVKRNILTTVNARVDGRVLIQSYANLVIKQSASLELMSYDTSTAFIGEIESTATITYEGTPAGVVVANRYLAVSGANFVDISTPIKNKTLNSWKNAGVLFTGFPGSNYPSFGFVNAYAYDESDLGILNDGWFGAANITDSLKTTNGSNQLTTNAWRVYVGQSGGLTLNLADSGVVYKGDVDLLTTFNYGTDRTVDDGWNHVGNPYPSPINWGKIYRDADNSSTFGSNGLQPTIYVWKPQDSGSPNDENASYGFFNGATGVGVGLDSIIPSYQGFWVKAYEASNATGSYVLKMKESHKHDSNSSSFYKSNSNVNKSLVEVSLTGNSTNDKIWFHPFDGATVLRDQSFDVQRFGVDTLFSRINFSDLDSSLGLWVNAIPNNQQMLELPLWLSAITSDSLALTFTNLDQYRKDYGCIQLVDLLNNITYYLTVDSTISFWANQGFEGVRFVLRMNRVIDTRTEIQDGKCANIDDGMLNIDLMDFPTTVDFELWKDGGLMERITTHNGAISIPLGVGEYQLINRIGLISCTSNQLEFTIHSAPEVVVNFTGPDKGLVNEEVLFLNESNNASKYEWNYGDSTPVDSTFYGIHSYQNPGIYLVKLTAVNEAGCPPSSVTREIEIMSQVNILEKQLPNDIVLFESQNQIIVKNLSDSNFDLSMLSVDGRLLYKSTIEKGEIHINLNKTGNIVIINIARSNSQYSIKIFH